jgi:chromosome segregation ATPase
MDVCAMRGSLHQTGIGASTHTPRALSSNEFPSPLSPTVTPRLQSQAADLRHREEQLLLDLAGLYDASAELDRVSGTLEEARDALANRPVDIDQIALNLAAYSRQLEVRARRDRILLESPIDDPSRDLPEVLRLESEVAALRASLPPLRHTCDFSSRQKAAQARAASNSDRECDLQIRQASLEARNSAADSLLRESSIQATEAADRRREAERTAKRLLDTAPAISAADLENARHRKELLMQRKARIPARKAHIDEECRTGEAERDSQEQRLRDLEAELERLRDLLRMTDSVKGDIHAAAAESRALGEEYGMIEDEAKEAERRIEEQNRELMAIEECEAELEQKRRKIEAEKLAVNKKEEELRRRRAALGTALASIEDAKKEVAILREAVKKVEGEVAKVDGELSLEITKGKEMQEKLNSMVGDYSLNPEDESLAELQKLFPQRSL